MFTYSWFQRAMRYHTPRCHQGSQTVEFSELSWVYVDDIKDQTHILTLRRQVFFFYFSVLILLKKFCHCCCMGSKSVNKESVSKIVLNCIALMSFEFFPFLIKVWIRKGQKIHMHISMFPAVPFTITKK